jgi:phage terminase small subunit
MSALANARHERFVQGVLKGWSALESYRKAGYRGQGHSAESGAHQLMRNSEVSSRLEELRSQTAQKTLITVEKLTNDLLQIRELAVRDGQHSAAVAALSLVAKMHGFLVERREVDIVHHKPARDALVKDLELSEEEWVRLYAPRLDQ